MREMTLDQYSRFQRSLGVIEGLSFHMDKEIAEALLDQCEILDDIIEAVRKGAGEERTP